MYDVWPGGTRGLSPVVGVAAMTAIVVVLAAVATASVLAASESALSTSQTHGAGVYSFDVEERRGAPLHVTPQSVVTGDSEFVLRVNGHEAYTWDGTDTLEVTCLYPGDEFQVITRTDGGTSLLTDHTVEEATGCRLGLTERFEYSIVESTKVRTGSEYAFGLAIDPDGPGPDGTYGRSVDARAVGPISFANDWHYSRRFDRQLHGVDAPVWLFVLTDNVHWDDAPNYAGELNWTDAPPAGRDPGSAAYSTSGSTVSPVSNRHTEPTNDVYLLFQPGCDRSTVTLIRHSGGYRNQILMDGEVVIDDASDPTAQGRSFRAPPIPCYGGEFGS